MRILAYDPYIPKEAAEALGVELTSLEELFASAKYISLHTTLTPETEGMIDDKLLQQLNPGSYLVNLSRGEAIDSLDSLSLCSMTVA